MRAVYCIHRGADTAQLGQHMRCQTTTQKCRVVREIRKRGAKRRATRTETNRPRVQ